MSAGSAGVAVEPLIEELRAQARRARLDLLAGVQGDRLILVVGGTDDPMAAAERFAGRFGPGPVVAGPLVRDLRSGVGLGPGRAGRAARRAGLAGRAPADRRGRAAARAGARRRRGRPGRR